MANVVQVPPKRALKISIVLVFFTFLYWGYSLAQQEVRFLKSELDSFIAPPITYRGTTYSVSQGTVFKKGEEVMSLPVVIKVLRIARFAVVNRINPIFSVGGTDPDALEKSIRLLRKSLDEYTAIYADTPKKERMGGERVIESTLYPIKFLENLSVLERLRVRLIASPNEKVVLDYNRQLKKTIGLYVSYIEGVEDAFKKFGDWERRTLGYWGGTNTAESTVLGLAVAKHSALGFQKQVEERESCYKGIIDSCTPLSTYLETFLTRDLLEDKGVQEHTLNQIARIHLINSHRNNSAKEEAAPMLSLLKNGCLSPNISPSYFSIRWTELPSLGVQSVHITPLNALLFYDLRNIPEEILRARGFLFEAKESGLDYLYQNPERFYKCPDAGKDTARVNTLYGISVLLNANPLFPDVGIDDNYTKKLASLENKVTSAVVNEGDVIEFINNLKTLLSQYGEHALAKKVGEDKVLLIEQLISYFYQNSVRFDELITTAARLNILNTVAERKYGPSAPGILIRVRGYQFLFLLMFNKSFVEQPATLFAKREEIPTQSFHTVTYPGSSLNHLSEEDIVDLIRKGNDDFLDAFWEEALDKMSES